MSGDSGPPPSINPVAYNRIEANALAFASLALILHFSAPYAGNAAVFLNAMVAICEVTAGVLGLFGLAYDPAFLRFGY